jgi:hypothetical protein
MSPFNIYWEKIVAHLQEGMQIPNWTYFHGFAGEKIEIAAIQANEITVISKNKNRPIHVPKQAFEFMFNNWNAYVSGKIKRSTLRESTFHSRYTISILKFCERFLN